MPADDLQSEPDEAVPKGGGQRHDTRGYRLWPLRWRWRISLILLLFIAIVASASWLGREKIAGDFIDDALAANGLEASYDIVSIGATRQIIANLVVGDPAAPDFTAEQVALDVAYTLGTPKIGSVEIIRPRLYGQVADGQVSFGSLDPLIYAESDSPSALPGISLKVIDGRALIESEWGAIGAKLKGQGRLSDGFEGILAVTAPGFGNEECQADSATLYGDLTTLNGRAVFDGPIRLRQLTCRGAEVASADLAARLTVWEDLSSIDGDLGIEAVGLSYTEAEIASVSGEARMLFGGSAEAGLRLGLNHDLTANGLSTEFGGLRTARLDGDLTVSDDFERSEWRAGLRASGIRADSSVTGLIADARVAGEGTLIQPLLAKFERGLGTVFADGELSGDIILRSDESGLRITVPQARLRNGAGEAVIALSNASYGNLEEGQQLNGNILIGGSDLPLINGRIERRVNGDLGLRLTMAEYSEGQNSLAIPQLDLRQSPSGRVNFNGFVQAGGDLPGGVVRGLEMPLEGSWAPRTGLSVGPRCVAVSFAELQWSELALSGRSMRICPEGTAMLRYRDTLELTAFSEMVDFSGSVGSSPTRITADRANLGYPHTSSIVGLRAVIGESDNAVRLSATELDLAFGEEIGGTFAGGNAALDIAPLDISELEGAWSFAEGVLSIEDATFLLTDRPGEEKGAEPRFEPLLSNAAALRFEENAILATADLRHPDTGILVSEVTVSHDLGSGAGRADIDVPGVAFTPGGFQPEDLSGLARGVLLLAEGTVTGSGAIFWDGDEIESEGRFRTDDFDFAAAFGLVEGVRGEIVFNDLINLTTAPQQVIEVAAVDPGIQVFGGRIVYSITDGQLVTVNDARWPFMGGELILRPVELNYGVGEGQSYIFEVVGLDAAAFVAQMEMDNLGATGIFDGTIPIFFDASGRGTIEGGLLIARPPGGNVAYVGELTYEDMGQMANFAFQSLRSLDYNQMSVELNGTIGGAIITKIRMDGIRQGEAASRNFVTRRIAKLPIRFLVNVRAENPSVLAFALRGLFDPTLFNTAAGRRSLGLDLIEVEESSDEAIPEEPVDE
ncbi:MAG: YdbH domain-containing protein [Pseudomonadota bacterium]